MKSEIDVLIDEWNESLAEDLDPRYLSQFIENMITEGYELGLNHAKRD